MLPEPMELIEAFHQVAKLAGIVLHPDALVAEKLPAPHRAPTALPNGKLAVYVFMWKEQCLKIGKVGVNSQARYTSQHYSPKSSQSNLAKSLLAARSELGLLAVSETDVGAWIKANTDRLNFLLSVDCGVPVLTLLEVFLQCRLRPKFEGFESQR